MRRFVSNVLAVAWREATVMRHDKAFVAVVSVQPVVMLLLFGLALSNEPANVPWAVLDESRSAASRRFLQEMETTGYFLAPTRVASRDEGVGELRDRLDDCRERLMATDELRRRRFEHLRLRVESLLERRILTVASESLDLEAELTAAAKHKEDPYTVADRIFRRVVAAQRR